MKLGVKQLLRIGERLRASYWFLPALLVVLSIALAFLLPWVDRAVLSRDALDWLRVRDPQSARSILTTIAAAMISVATLVFSVTIVALTLAATQFGSRLLYNFTRDRASQLVFGTFVGTFVYCLLSLPSVYATGEDAVPRLSLLVAILLAITGIGVLIFFIHHVAQSIQASHVIATVGNELRHCIERFFPASASRPAPPEPVPDERGRQWVIEAPESGILEVVDTDVLLAVARDNDLFLRVSRRPGDFVIAGTELACYDAERELPEREIERVGAAFATAHRRTLVQDIEFAVHQLVEIAVRALSPGINDPFTAIHCIDELGAGLARMLRCGDPVRLLYDSAGDPRVSLDATDFAGIADSAFHQIRQFGAGNPAIAIRMLDVIGELAVFVDRPERGEALAKHAGLVRSESLRGVNSDADRADIEAAHERAGEALAKAANREGR